MATRERREGVWAHRLYHVLLSRLSMIVRVNVVLNRVKVSCITSVDGIKLLVIDLIGQISRAVIGRLSVQP